LLKIRLEKSVQRGFRSEDLIKSESLTQDFYSYSKPAPYLIRGRRNRRIAGYGTVSTTQNMDKKTSQKSDIIKSSLLKVQNTGFIVLYRVFSDKNCISYIHVGKKNVSACDFIFYPTLGLVR
jgi:hypothetical protein